MILLHFPNPHTRWHKGSTTLILDIFCVHRYTSSASTRSTSFSFAKVSADQPFSECFIFDLTNGRVKVTASEWPSFVYDQDLYDPQDVEAGCMKGYLLLHVFLHIFCSNGDPTKQDGPKCGSITKINGICVVTGHMIAYATCQDGWCKQDGAFDMTAFYGSIVTLFEDQPEDTWVLQMLAWWNEQVFGDKNGCIDVDKTQDDHPLTSMVAQMAARCEAWAKEQAEAAAASAAD
ncbi:hypothetical protein F5146DRAFT_1005155 [Armillaria mellea]|nr:hypothetical protein F5146DRAFT_1005155 [Armillaria mellea]